LKLEEVSDEAFQGVAALLDLCRRPRALPQVVIEPLPQLPEPLLGTQLLLSSRLALLGSCLLRVDEKPGLRSLSLQLGDGFTTGRLISLRTGAIHLAQLLNDLARNDLATVAEGPKVVEHEPRDLRLAVLPVVVPVVHRLRAASVDEDRPDVVPVVEGITAHSDDGSADTLRHGLSTVTDCG
jgi:hypothetical protein